MSKMAEMAQTIEELRSAAASINAAADWLYQQFSGDDNEAQPAKAPAKKALGIDNLGIEITEDTVSFPWFTEMPEPDAVKAYTHFIAALGKMSRDLKRISATEKEVDNEKYAFRCFLLRLGFIGNEYKAERKILLKNLSGNSSWKNGAPEKEPIACE